MSFFHLPHGAFTFIHTQILGRKRGNEILTHDVAAEYSATTTATRWRIWSTTHCDPFPSILPLQFEDCPWTLPSCLLKPLRPLQITHPILQLQMYVQSVLLLPHEECISTLIWLDYCIILVARREKETLKASRVFRISQRFPLCLENNPTRV